MFLLLKSMNLVLHKHKHDFQAVTPFLKLVSPTSEKKQEQNDFWDISLRSTFAASFNKIGRTVFP